MSRGLGPTQRALVQALEVAPREIEALPGLLGARADNVRRALEGLTSRSLVRVSEGRVTLAASLSDARSEGARLAYERLEASSEPSSEPVHAARVFHASWRQLLAEVEHVDALITDAPYSSRTHRGHDDGARVATAVTSKRRALPYAAWAEEDVDAFVSAWAPRVRGWFVSVTDHVLVPAWERALEAAGRYVFAPLPLVIPGSRVRVRGDGPSNWTCWVVVARPRLAAFASWGTLRGAYLPPEGGGERPRIAGGKPLWFARALVEDYSREGDLVCDPCVGAGTFARAAIELGRRVLAGDCNEAAAHAAASWLAEGWERHRQPGPVPAPFAQQVRAVGDGNRDRTARARK